MADAMDHRDGVAPSAQNAKHRHLRRRGCAARPQESPPRRRPPSRRSRRRRERAAQPAPQPAMLRRRSSPPTAAPASPAPENPGIVGAFGTWMQQGVTSMSTGFDAMAKGAADAASTMAKGAADVATGAATVAKDAADVAVDGVAKLPVSGFASGHEQCALASNGAPDCRGGRREFVPHPRFRHRHQRRLPDLGKVSRRPIGSRAASGRKASARWSTSSPAPCADRRLHSGACRPAHLPVAKTNCPAAVASGGGTVRCTDPRLTRPV